MNPMKIMGRNCSGCPTLVPAKMSTRLVRRIVLVGAMMSCGTADWVHAHAFRKDRECCGCGDWNSLSKLGSQVGSWLSEELGAIAGGCLGKPTPPPKPTTRPLSQARQPWFQKPTALRKSMPQPPPQPSQPRLDVWKLPENDPLKKKIENFIRESSECPRDDGPCDGTKQLGSGSFDVFQMVNPTLRELFRARRRRIAWKRAVREDEVYERWLFHGTSLQ